MNQPPLLVIRVIARFPRLPSDIARMRRHARRRGSPEVNLRNSVLPAGANPARSGTQSRRDLEPAREYGPASVQWSECLNSRKGRLSETRGVTACVGIDVSEDRLDVHRRPSGEAFAAGRGGKGLEISSKASRRLMCRRPCSKPQAALRQRWRQRSPAPSLPLAVVNPRQIRNFAKAVGKLGPRPMRSMPKPRLSGT
jgi:hypothetical protein